MKHKRTAMICIAVCVPFALLSQLVIDWNKIHNWTGNGENRAAIGVQFNDGYALSTYVWGFRWSDDDAPSLKDVMERIALGDRSLCILQQQTSADGDFTLAGIGYDRDRTDCRDIFFDFQAATSDSKLNYNYYAPGGPGDNTPALCASAVALAKDSNIIFHPVNAAAFKYPAYDYDHWHMPSLSPHRHWNAGWNIGNWVVWKGEAGKDTYSYSGMAYSSAKVKNDDVIIWNFNRHTSYPVENDPIDGYTGASRPVRPAEYTISGISSRPGICRDRLKVVKIFDLRGRECRAPLAPGIYIFRYSDNSQDKLLIN